MILVTDAPDGLYLQRSDADDPPLFAASDEVAQAIADMLARTTGRDEEAWDAWAALCGNDGSSDEVAAFEF